MISKGNVVPKGNRLWSLKWSVATLGISRCRVVDACLTVAVQLPGGRRSRCPLSAVQTSDLSIRVP